MKKFFKCVFLSLNLSLQAGIPTTGDYFGPTEMLIARETWNKIEIALIHLKVPIELVPLFNSIALEENWGHIGYHGSTHGFRFYQDVIKFTIEEVLAIPIRQDFHFLRIPGDADLNLNSVDEFADYWGKNVDNRDSLRAKQLLSLNYGIYSNFTKTGSCSACLFAKDRSSSDVNYVKQLAPFYKRMGIKESKLKELYSIYNKWMSIDSGILLQLSENSHLSNSSHEAYDFADKLCYPAIKGGYRYDQNLISVHFQKAMTEDYVNQNTDISDQIRLLINNRYTLNPYSHLIVKRWGLEDEKTITSYEQEMRKFIRTLKYDSKKVQQYHKALLAQWNDVDE